MTDQYIPLTYRQYKHLEEQIARFKSLETTHITVDKRFYHKAFRLEVGDITFEFIGPPVMAPPNA